MSIGKYIKRLFHSPYVKIKAGSYIVYNDHPCRLMEDIIVYSSGLYESIMVEEKENGGAIDGPRGSLWQSTCPR